MKPAVFLFLIGALYCFAGTVCQDEGYFWHVTDLHWDFSYTIDHLSCTGQNVSDRGLYGDYLCDSPWALLQAVTAEMQNIKLDVDFIAWTGDNVPHFNSSYLSTDKNIQVIKTITELLQEYFPGVTVYPALGNHDYYTDYQYPPYNNELYNATYLLWKSWINDTTQEQAFFKGGYYTVRTKHGLRIIALNTVLYSNYDNLTQGLDDPAGQFAWLDTQLSNARTHKEKVLILAHIPPGYATPLTARFMSANFNKRFIDILLRHSDVIVGTHFGHEHHDNFRLVYSSTGVPKVAIYVAPSVTPWSFDESENPRHNPGVRLIKYDRLSGRHLELLQYYVDLPAVNTERNLQLKLGYTATKVYGISDITPCSLNKLKKKFSGVMSPDFKTYVNWYNTDAIQNNTCDVICHKTMLCGIEFLEQDDFSKCLSQWS